MVIKFMKISVWGVFLLMYACGVKPENPGQCNLSCANSVIGGADASYEIKLASKAPSFECATGLTQATEFLGPVNVKFVVWDKYKKSSGEETLMPVPSISFNPLINGALVASRSNGENVTKYAAGDALPDGTTHDTPMYYPYQYVGIVTPKSNWCSDSCGVISIEVWPYCPVAGASNNLSVQVATGGKFSDTAEIAITTPSL